MRQKYATYILIFCAILINSPNTGAFAKVVKEGAKCSKVKQIKIFNAVEYSCVKIGSKLLWQKKIKKISTKPAVDKSRVDNDQTTPTATPSAKPSSAPEAIATPEPVLALGPSVAAPGEEILVYKGPAPAPNKNIEKSREINRQLTSSKPTSNLKLWIYDPENPDRPLNSPGIWFQKDGGEWLFSHVDRRDGGYDTKFEPGKYVIDIVEPDGNRTKYERGRYSLTVNLMSEVTIEGLLANSQGYFTVTAIVKKQNSAIKKSFDVSSKCQLEDKTGNITMSNGFPRADGRLPNRGIVKALIIPVEFSDLPGIGAPASIYREMAKGTADFYYKQSQRTLRFEFTTLPSYVNLNVPVGTFGLGAYNSGDAYSFFMAGLKAVENIVDISQFDIAYVLPPSNVKSDQIAYGPAFPGNPNSRDYQNSTGRVLNGSVGGHDAWQNLAGAGWKWMAHETGHTFGLYDWYTLDGTDPFGPWDIMSSNWSTEAIELNSWNRFISGWLADSQVICLEVSDLTNTPKTFTIENVSVESNKIKSLMVKLSDSKILVIEARATGGLDVLSPNRTGLLAYTVDTSVPTIKGIAVTHAPDRMPNDPRYSVLKEGEIIKVSGLQIRAGKRSADEFEFSMSKG